MSTTEVGDLELSERELAIWKRARAEAAHRVSMHLGEIDDQRRDNARRVRDGGRPDREAELLAKRGALEAVRASIRHMLPGIVRGQSYGPLASEPFFSASPGDRRDGAVGSS